MKSMILYVERDSLIHRIDPLSKLLYILTAILIPMIVPGRGMALAAMLFSFGLLAVGRVFRRVLPLIGYSSFLLLSVIIIQGLYYSANQTVFFQVGPLVFYQEGLWYAMGICLRTLNILASFALLVLTTKPTDLINTLVRKGLSPRLGYVLSSVLQIIPQMASTTGMIMDAQRSRGMETEGNLFVRLKAFLPLLGPAVMNSLVATKERAMALDIRGFTASAKQTFLHEEFRHPHGKAIKITLILAIIVAAAWRVAA